MIRLLLVLLSAIALNAGLPLPASAQSNDDDHSYINGRTDEQLLAMLDDYVKTDSRTWSYNRYAAGSMHDIEVTRRGGRVIRMQASYAYDGFMGRMLGWVEMDIEWNGNTALYCITYHDYPDTCRPIRDPY